MSDIPGYTILRPLGQGGMATVYLALQQSLGREVALKVLASKLAQDADASERFLREARLAANLHHPHIVPIHNVGMHEGVAYIAMQFEPGGTVASVAGVCDSSTALRIIRDIATALDYAHGKGVVHRDIKPDNILRRTDGSCVLSDFGIARVIESETALTREGTSIGTPQYMSPEQLRGEKVDGRADLYSLGVVLYQLLTGDLPYAGSDGWAIGMQHINADIPRLPPAMARLQPLVDSLLAKKPDARPQTGAEVVRQIDALLSFATPPPTAPLAAATSKPRRLVSRNWLLLGAISLVLAVGVIALSQFRRGNPVSHQPAIATLSPRSTLAPATAKSIAVLPFENRSADKDNIYFAGGMQDEILTRLAGIRDLKVVSRSSTAKYDSHPENLKAVGLELGVATLLEGSVQKAGDAVHITVRLVDAHTDSQLWAESYDRDLKDIFAVERDVATQVAQALKAQLLPAESARVGRVPTQDKQAYDLYLRASYHFNRADDQNVLVGAEMPQAIALYEQALARDPNFALAAAALSKAHMYQYHYAPFDHSVARMDAAKAAAERALSLQPDLGEGHFALGLYYYWSQRDYVQAAQEWSLARRTLPNSADIERLSSAMARRQGRWDDAIAWNKKAAALAPRSADPYNQLGTSYEALHRYAEADQAYSRAAAVTQDPAEQPIWSALNNLAWKGDLQPLRTALEAMAPGSDVRAGNAYFFYQFAWLSRDYRAAVKVAEADPAADWSSQSNIVLPRPLYLAWAHEALGEHAKAVETYTAAQAETQANLKARPDDANLHLALGFADAGLGLMQEAMRQGELGAALLPVSKDAISGPDYRRFLAQLYVRVGEKDAALKLLDQLIAMPTGMFLSPALLKLDPVWDPLRKDPRFQKLITDGEAAMQRQANP